MSIETAYEWLYGCMILFLVILAGVMLFRAIIGPRVTDRIMSVNMLGTLVVSCIAVASQLLQELWLLDVAMIYTMISFISVLILATMYIPRNRKMQVPAGKEKQTVTRKTKKDRR